MKTSEALTRLYNTLYGDLDPDQIKKHQGELFFIFAQAPKSTAESQLNRLMFELPANVLQQAKTDPNKAKDMLTRGIAGVLAWEMISVIETCGISEQEWQNYIDSSNIVQLIQEALTNNNE